MRETTPTESAPSEPAPAGSTRRATFAPYDDVAPLLAARPLDAHDARAQAVVDALGVREPPVVRAREAGPRTRRDDVEITPLVWETGFGPTTRAWLAHPAGADPATLPGALALHAHGGVRSVGAEVMVDDGASSARAVDVRGVHYAGRAPVNGLAARGIAVLVHDAFSWGSRRLLHADVPTGSYDETANRREGDLSRWASLLGTSLAGLVALDDLVALDVLAGLTAGPLGLVGLSGGGARAVHLAALDPRPRASVLACSVATWASMVDHHVSLHSWLNVPPGLPRVAELPDLACPPGGDVAVLAQFAEDDPLFPRAGMRDADALMRSHRAQGGAPYEGRWYPGGHTMSEAMQDDAWEFLVRELG